MPPSKNQEPHPMQIREETKEEEMSGERSDSEKDPEEIDKLINYNNIDDTSMDPKQKAEDDPSEGEITLEKNYKKDLRENIEKLYKESIGLHDRKREKEKRGWDLKF